MDLFGNIYMEGLIFYNLFIISRNIILGRGNAYDCILLLFNYFKVLLVNN